MTIQESFETSAKQIFKEIYPHIKSHQTGTLRTVIYRILDNRQAGELCQKYGIKNNASLDEDLNFSDDIIHMVSFNTQRPVKQHKALKEVGNFVNKKINRPFKNFINDNEEDKMEFIVIAAVILIGSYYAQKSLNNRTSNTIPDVLSSQPICTAICLAVPASAVYGLTLRQRINRDEMIQVIESATEFLCIEAEDADKQSVHTITQEVSPDSQLKFYIRIDIPNGQDIINAKTKYVIKRDLPQNTEGKILQLGRLRDASVLKLFNRI